MEEVILYIIKFYFLASYGFSFSSIFVQDHIYLSAEITRKVLYTADKIWNIMKIECCMNWRENHTHQLASHGSSLLIMIFSFPLCTQGAKGSVSS